MSTVSRVELDTGQVVTVDHPEEWPEYKVIAFAELNAPEATRTEAPSGTDNKDDTVTMGDLLSLGPARFAAQFVPDVFLISPSEMVESLVENQRQRDQGLPVENTSVANERRAREMAGVPVDAELGFGQELVAAISDPLTATGAPLKRGVTNYLTGLIPGVASTVAGTGAGMVAPRVVQGLGGGELAQELSTAIAGGAVSTIAGVGTTAALSTAGKVGSDAISKIRGKDSTLGVASDALANDKVKAEINRIKETSSDTEVAKAVENLAALKQEIPDLEVGGLVATLTNNPIVRDWVRKTTQNNKGFQKSLTEKIQRDGMKIKEKFDEYMPVDEEIGRPVVEDIATRQKELMESRLRTSLERKNENIDNVLSGLTSKVVGTKDSVDVGRAATNLLARKEKTVRQAANKLYTIAEKQGAKVTLPESEVLTVYNMFKGARLSDIFGPESSVSKKLESKWSPKEAEAEEGTTYEMPEVSGNDLISLKKAINSELSLLFRVRDKSTKDNQLIRSLYSLKDIVDTTLVRESGNSPKFVKAVRDADSFYYEQLGLPLKAEGMREIKSRKFESGAATSLMNYEQARDYVNFVGKPGMAVVRHAVRLKAEKGVLKDGQLDQKKLENFIRKNRRIIEFAGLSEELTTASGKLRSIKNTEARHNQAYNEKSRELANGFYKAVQEKNLSTVVTEMMNNPGKRKAFMKDIEQLDKAQQDMVITGLRQEFLAQAVSTQGTMQDFINKHSDTSLDLFGNKYVNNINKIAGLKDLLDRMSVLLKDSLGETAVVDGASERTGVSYAEFVGTFRNQILSTERKAINLISKSVLSKGKNKYYVKSAEVLLDPDVVQKLANPPVQGLQKFLKAAREGSGEYLKEVGAYFTESISNNLTFSTLKAIGAATDAPTPAEQQELEAVGGN